jgi:hypothetical protein
LSWIGVENRHFYPETEGLTLKSSSRSLGTSQGKKSFTLAH